MDNAVIPNREGENYNRPRMVFSCACVALPKQGLTIKERLSFFKELFTVKREIHMKIADIHFKEFSTQERSVMCFILQL